MLELDDVSAGYGPVQALSAVSIRVMPGEIVTLIGANGAGKSTLLMTICGDPRPRGGRIILEGRDIAGLPTHAIMRLGLAQSPEGRRVFPRMTVDENLLMGAETAGQRRPRGAARRRSSPSSRGSASAWRSAPARSPAASSRCSPSAAP